MDWLLHLLSILRAVVVGSDLIDVSAGPIAAGDASIRDIGTEIFNMIIDVASGKKQPWAEKYKLHNDFCIFNPAPIT